MPATARTILSHARPDLAAMVIGGACPVKR